MNPRWYETFFDDAALDVWQGACSPEQTAAEVEYLDAILGIRGRGSLLDLACGNGRHAVALAARGYSLTGIDIAEGNRERVAALSAAAGVSMDLIIGDITRLEDEAAYDGAYIWGNSFGYFPRDTTRRFLAALARALKPGARVVIDTAMAAESILGDLGRRSWHRISDEIRVLLESRYIPRESRLDTIYTTIRHGRIVSEATAHVWIYTSGEIVALAEAAGLEALDLHGDVDGNAFELGDDRLLLILERSA